MGLREAQRILNVSLNRTECLCFKRPGRSGDTKIVPEMKTYTRGRIFLFFALRVTPPAHPMPVHMEARSPERGLVDYPIDLGPNAPR